MNNEISRTAVRAYEAATGDVNFVLVSLDADDHPADTGTYTSLLDAKAHAETVASFVLYSFVEGEPQIFATDCASTRHLASFDDPDDDSPFSAFVRLNGTDGSDDGAFEVVVSQDGDPDREFFHFTIAEFAENARDLFKSRGIREVSTSSSVDFCREYGFDMEPEQVSQLIADALSWATEPEPTGGVEEMKQAIRLILIIDDHPWNSPETIELCEASRAQLIAALAAAGETYEPPARSRYAGDRLDSTDPEPLNERAFAIGHWNPDGHLPQGLNYRAQIWHTRTAKHSREIRVITAESSALDSVRAFDGVKVRPVAMRATSKDEALDIAFHHGQNDFEQREALRKTTCSASVGDVIRLFKIEGGVHVGDFRILSVGFERLGREESIVDRIGLEADQMFRGYDEPKTVSPESMHGEPVDDNDPFFALQEADEVAQAFEDGGEVAAAEVERKLDGPSDLEIEDAHAMNDDDTFDEAPKSSHVRDLRTGDVVEIVGERANGVDYSLTLSLLGEARSLRDGRLWQIMGTSVGGTLLAMEQFFDDDTDPEFCAVRVATFVDQSGMGLPAKRRTLLREGVVERINGDRVESISFSSAR